MKNIQFKKTQRIEFSVSFFAALFAYLIFTTLVPDTSPIKNGYKYLFFGILIISHLWKHISEMFFSDSYDSAYERYIKKYKSPSIRKNHLIRIFLLAFAASMLSLYLGLKDNIIVAFLGS